MTVRFILLQKTLFFQLTDDLLSRLESILQVVAVDPIASFTVGNKCRAIDFSTSVEDADSVQAKAFANLKIIKVVAGGDLQCSGSKCLIDIGIKEQRDHTTRNGQPNLFTNEMLVAFVFRVHSYGGVAKHCFRSRSRNDQRLRRVVGKWISDVPKTGVCFLMNDFDVGQRCLAARAPVNQPLRSVEQAVFPETNEGFLHRKRKTLVHGKTLVLPIAGDAERLELMQDRASRFFFPFPDSGNEFIAPNLCSAQPLSGQTALDDVLHRDTGMVRPRDPEHAIAVHSFVTTEDILKRVVERMAHMQRSGYIRWRNDHRKMRSLPLGRLKCSQLHPMDIPFRFNSAVIVGFR